MLPTFGPEPIHTQEQERSDDRDSNEHADLPARPCSARRCRKEGSSCIVVRMTPAVAGSEVWRGNGFGTLTPLMLRKCLHSKGFAAYEA